MGRSYIDQSSEIIFDIAAGDAANTTYTKYIDVRSFQRAGHQVDWTAGSGGGTVVIKAYFSTHEFIDANFALQGDTGSVFQDNSLRLFGVASLSDDSITTDSVGIIGCATWVKYTATIANKNATTSLKMIINKCS